MKYCLHPGSQYNVWEERSFYNRWKVGSKSTTLEHKILCLYNITTSYFNLKGYFYNKHRDRATGNLFRRASLCLTSPSPLFSDIVLCISHRTPPKKKKKFFCLLFIASFVLLICMLHEDSYLLCFLYLSSVLRTMTGTQ